MLLRFTTSHRPAARARFARRPPTPHSLRPLAVFGPARDAAASRLHARRLVSFDLIELFPDAILLVDSRGVIRVLNTAAYELFGYARGTLEGRPLDVLLPPAVRAEHPGHLRTFFADPSRRAMAAARTLQARHGSGSLIPVEVTLKPVTLEGETWVAASVRDVTQQRRAQREAEETADRIRSLMHLARVGTWEVEVPTCEVRLSPQLAAMVGAPAQRLTVDGLLELIHPDDRAVLSDTAQRAIRDRASYHQNVRVRGGGGEWRWFETRAFVELDASGEPAMIRGLSIDSTEQSQARELLVVADRLASVGLLAAGVAHELNNPLTAVLTNLEMLRHDVAQLGEPDRFDPFLRVLDDALEGSRRMRDLLKDLRVFSRADATRVVPVDAVAVVEKSLRLARGELRRRATVEVDLDPVPPVRCTEARLGQVFLNLILNAAQAIDEGSPETNRIRVTTRLDPSQRVAIEVSDTGAGMTPDVLKRLFVPFFTTKPVGVGTGLGLSISHRIVTELGGEIVVESVAGKGSTFRVLLPPA